MKIFLGYLPFKLLRLVKKNVPAIISPTRIYLLFEKSALLKVRQLEKVNFKPG